jgi:hypothetical protein
VCADGGDGGGFNVGGVRVGEWLHYTLEVKEAGAYAVDLRLASPGTGGTVRLEFSSGDGTGPLPVPDTGGWQQYQTVSATSPVRLAAGRQAMRVLFDAPASPQLTTAGGHVCNLNWIALRPAAASAGGVAEPREPAGAEVREPGEDPATRGGSR